MQKVEDADVTRQALVHNIYTVLLIFRSNLDKGIIEVDLKTPYLFMKSDYEIQGRMLVLPISGKGDTTSNYSKCFCCC